jgi:hypothetical protein
MSTSSREVLKLYRAILRHSKNLKYTDKQFYIREVKQEFKKGVKSRNTEYQIKKLNAFIDTNFGGIL